MTINELDQCMETRKAKWRWNRILMYAYVYVRGHFDNWLVCNRTQGALFCSEYRWMHVDIMALDVQPITSDVTRKHLPFKFSAMYREFTFSHAKRIHYSLDKRKIITGEYREREREEYSCPWHLPCMRRLCVVCGQPTVELWACFAWNRKLLMVIPEFTFIECGLRYSHGSYTNTQTHAWLNGWRVNKFNLVRARSINSKISIPDVILLVCRVRRTCTIVHCVVTCVVAWIEE